MSIPQRQLNLLDVICINVGIVIGVGIFKSSPFIATNTSGPYTLISCWVLGGVAALLGSLCYAELTTRFPRQGGEYVFLSEAFGKQAGFLFAWADLWIIRPGNVGSMAFVFATYAQEVLGIQPQHGNKLLVALAPVAVLTFTNILGVKSSKWTQNALTIGKVLGLVTIIVTGLVLLPSASATSTPHGVSDTVAASPKPLSDLVASHSLAMILIMFSYGGWNEMSNVAAEMRDPRRTIVRGLVGSALTVSGIYVLANCAFVHALGFSGLANANAVAAQVMQLRFGEVGAKLISILICVSSLSAINGTLFTGPRIYYALGCDHNAFRWIGHWSDRFSVPARALILLSAVSMAMVVVFGAYDEDFEQLVKFTAPVFWLFFLGVGLALFVLRRRPAGDEVFRVPFGPVIPTVFCLLSAGMVYASVRHAIENRSIEGAWSVAVLAIGIAIACGFHLGKRRQDGSSLPE